MPSRDLDRIRELLIYLEEQPGRYGDVPVAGEPYFRSSDGYQFQLMGQAGFIHDRGADLATGLPVLVSITFAGHDYLDAIRNEGIWEQTKNAVAETGGGAALDIVKAVATGFLKKQLEKHTGLEL